MATVSEDVLQQVLKMRGGTADPANSTATPVEPEPEFKLPKIIIGSNEQAFSKVFGFKPKSGRDHALPKFKDTDWDESVRVHIPPEDVADSYIWPKEETETAVVAIVHGDKQLAIGPTGSGKSTLYQCICAKLRIPFIRVNFFNQVEYSAVFGMPSMEEGTLGYHHGPIGQLGVHGGVLCLDEFASASADITMSLQYPLEDKGKIYLPDYPGTADEKMITPHPWFRIVATDNTELQGDTTGRHAGTNVQNTATLDRFQTVVRLDYLNRTHEKKVLKLAVKGLPDHWIKDMLEMARLVRRAHNNNDINLTMSPRTLINWGRKAVYWGDPMKGLKTSFFDKLIDDDKKVVNEFIQKIYTKGIN